MAKSRYVSPEQVEQIIELSRRGLGVTQIAEKIGLSKPTVSRYRRANGFRCHGSDVTEERRQRVAELTRQGWPAEKIADKLKTTARTVVRDRKELGISQPSGRPLSQQEIETVERLLDDGASLYEAARTIGRRPGMLSRNKRFRGRAWTRQQIAEYMAIRRLELACG